MKTDFNTAPGMQATKAVALPKETIVARLSRNAILLVSASLIAALPFLF